MPKKITAKHELGEGAAPAAVRVTVEQGDRVLQAADVAPGEPAEFAVDDGDYTVKAQALVPAGDALSIAVAVPVRLTVDVSA